MSKKVWMSTKIQVMGLALIVGVLVFFVKSYAAEKSGSSALYSDALEGLVNILAAAFGLFATWISEKPADRDHPYGHEKIEFFSGVFEGGLIAIAGLLMLWDGVQSFIRPEVIEHLETGLILNIAAGGVNGVLGFFLVRYGKRVHSEIIRADGVHLLSDLMTTVGMAVGLGLVLLTGLLWIDPLLSIVMGLLLLKASWGLINKSTHALLDGADPVFDSEMLSALKEIPSDPSVIWIKGLKTQTYGKRIHADLRVIVPAPSSIEEAQQRVASYLSLIKAKMNKFIQFHPTFESCERKWCEHCVFSPCLLRQHAFKQPKEMTIDSLVEDNIHSPH